MTVRRAEGAWLAGVCAGTARALGWNVWALRALFVLFLLVKPFWAVVAYAALAVVFRFLPGPAGRRDSNDLASPELAERKRRIAELERRFRDLEH